MTANTEPRGGLEYGWDPGEDGWGPSMNANLLRLSRVGFHPSVASKSTTAPPGSPVSGEGYIVPSGATGAWSGQSGKIAVWDGSAWAYTTPRDGFLVHVADADGLALYDGGAWSADVLRADRLATAYAHSQSATNPHGTTAAQVGALPSIVLSGVVNANSINGGLPCAVSFNAVTSWANFPAEFDGGSSRCALLQLVGGDAGNGPLTTQILFSTRWGGMYHRERATYPVGGGAWNQWTGIWDDGLLPVSTFMKSVLDDTSAPNARTTLGAAPLAGAEILIHSDFGRSISGAGWQSTFTDNSAAGLLLPANSVSNGTSIRFEQFFENIQSSTTGNWQLAIGPLLSPGTGPSVPAYFDVVDVRGSIGGAGRLFVDVEFLGVGSEMVAHVSARVFSGAFGTDGDVAQMAHGTIPFDATSARYIDIQAYPAGMGAGPVVRRNRVFRRNP